MKITFLQSIPYSADESRLAKYHGAIFAEEFQKRGVACTKMVLGDPTVAKPKSPLLSVSTREQRCSPAWWREQACDVAVVYGGTTPHDNPVMRAIHEGSPSTKIVLKADAAYATPRQTVQGVLQAMRVAYVQDRHGHTRRGEHDQSHPAVAALHAVACLVRLANPRYVRVHASTYRYPHVATFASQSVVEDQAAWLRHYGYVEEAERIRWHGYPVRKEFAYNGQSKRPRHVISVANWKHAKDIPLHGKALAKAFDSEPLLTFTVVGANSAMLVNEILRYAPQARTAITQYDELSQTDLPGLLMDAQVFLLCSHKEGYCSAVAEALCAGCSTALSTGIGVPCFREFVANGCGTQARSRSPEDMADALLSEIRKWEDGQRSPRVIAQEWSKTLAPSLCDRILRYCDATTNT